MRIYSVYSMVATGASALLSLQNTCGLKLKIEAEKPVETPAEAKYEGKEGPLQLYIRFAGNSITNPEEDNASVCCDVITEARVGDIRAQLKRLMPNDTEENASFQDLFLRGVFVFGGEKVDDDETLEF